MRLAFLGTPAAAVPSLRALHGAGHDLVLVVTRPDARRGRGSTTTPSPVKSAALQLGLRVSHDIGDVATSGAELGVVVAYGRIIAADVLDAVTMVNVHFSLLPRWRGAAPVERAILAGDDVTGVCVMDVAVALDEGDVHDRVEVPIGPDVTASALRAELAEVGARLLVERLDAGLGAGVPQTGEVTYAHKIVTDDLRLDWNRTAVELHRVVRVGGAFTTWRGERFKIHAASVEPSAGPGGDGRNEPGTLDDDVVACGDGAGLRLVEVQEAGSSRMSFADWANGVRPVDGERFGGTVEP